MIINERKEIICQKHNDYLQIIYKLGNKMMLQKHLILLAIQLNVAKNKTEVLNAIKELEEADIIKRINFAGTSNKFIIFKKYAIRYVTGAKKSSDVAAMKTFNTNLPYLENIFKVHAIINIYLPSFNKRSQSSTLEDLLSFIEQTNSSILLNKNHGLDYYLNTLQKKIFMERIDLSEFKTHVRKLEEEKLLRQVLLNKKNKEFLDDYNKVFKDPIYLATKTIGTLFKKGIYIKQIYFKENNLVVNLMYFDVTNSQNANRIGEHCAVAYRVFKELFNCKIKINFIVYAWNKVASENIQKELVAKRINPFTRIESEYTKLDLVLKNNNIHFLDLENIKVTVISLDCELLYLDGKKILNLTNNKS